MSRRDTQGADLARWARMRGLMTLEQRARFGSSGATELRRLLRQARARADAAALEYALDESPGDASALVAADAAVDHVRVLFTYWIVNGRVHAPSARDLAPADTELHEACRVARMAALRGVLEALGQAA